MAEYGGLLTRGEDALGGVSSRSLPDERSIVAAQRSPPAELLGSDPGMVVATRAGAAPQTGSDPGREIPDAQSDTGGMLSSQLCELLEVNDINEDETSEAVVVRLDQMSMEVLEMGYSPG